MWLTILTFDLLNFACSAHCFNAKHSSSLLRFWAKIPNCTKHTQQLKCEFPSIANLVKSQVNIKCSSGSVHALSTR